jgi:hypothetical protein
MPRRVAEAAGRPDHEMPSLAVLLAVDRGAVEGGGDGGVHEEHWRAGMSDDDVADAADAGEQAELAGACHHEAGRGVGVLEMSVLAQVGEVLARGRGDVNHDAIPP